MRQLLAIREHGSVAKASQALGISQPSLSQAILRLEDQLKVRLIERTSSGSHLTAIGEVIAERSAKVVAESEQLVREVELIAGGEAGLVRLGVGTSLTKAFLPHFILRIAEQLPALRLSVQVLDHDRLVPLLMNRELDLVICAVGSEIATEGLIATPVFDSCGIAVAHPAHPLANSSSIPVDHLENFPLAGAALDDFANLRILGLGQNHEDRYMANSYEALLPLAISGAAILIAAEFAARPHIASGELVKLDLDWSLQVRYAAITTSAAIYSPVIAKLIRAAEILGAELL